MSAPLNYRQFEEQPSGSMSISEMRDRIDPNMKPWSKFLRQEHGYNRRLADDIKEKGIEHPILLQQASYVPVGEVIWDGHHRLAAAQLLGHTEVPYKRMNPKDV